MGYIKGKDLLFRLGEGCVGHCTEHTINYTNSTSDTAVKPPAEDPITAGLFKEALIDGKEITVDFKGLRFEGESEAGFDEIAEMWGSGEPVECAAFKRTKDAQPYLKGKFIVTDLTETNGADGIAEYNGKLKVYGTPDIYPGKTPKAS